MQLDAFLRRHVRWAFRADHVGNIVAAGRESMVAGHCDCISSFAGRDIDRLQMMTVRLDHHDELLSMLQDLIPRAPAQTSLAPLPATHRGPVALAATQPRPSLAQSHVN